MVVMVVIVVVIFIQDRVMSTSRTNNVADYTARSQEEPKAATKPTQEADLRLKIQRLIEVTVWLGAYAEFNIVITILTNVYIGILYTRGGEEFSFLTLFESNS